jgi:cytoskeleton protein RodZ
MTSVGKLLRSAREDQLRSMAEIADELCITQRYLRAIEEDDLTVLPGVFFYKSFVRQYAAILKIDPVKLQSGVDALCPKPEELAEARASNSIMDPRTASFIRPVAASGASVQQAMQPVRQPEPLLRDFNRYVSDRRIGMSAAALAVVLLACSGFYAWWTQAPSVKAPSIKSPSQPVNTADSPNGGSPVTIPIAANGGTAEGIRVAELNLSATETTWLSITANGKEIFSGVLQPSQTKTLTGVEGARLKLGNAGGIEARWKGKPIGPFGTRGQVLVVQLTDDNFEIVTPPPESSDSTL